MIGGNIPRAVEWLDIARRRDLMRGRGSRRIVVYVNPGTWPDMRRILGMEVRHDERVTPGKLLLVDLDSFVGRLVTSLPDAIPAIERRLLELDRDTT